MGDAYSGGAPLSEFQAIHFCWAPIHWEDECTLAGLFEDESGHQWHTDQARLPHYRTMDDIPGTNDPAAVTWQGKVIADIKMLPGTRRAEAATIVMNDRGGQTLEMTLEPVMVHRMKGLGYQHPKWGHGKWHGELVIEAESWTDAELDPLAVENIHIQQVVVARCGDRVGHGVLEQMHIGPSPNFGFKDWFDSAG